MIYHNKETAEREQAKVKFALDDGFDVDLETGTFKGMASVFNVPIDTVPITVIRPGAFKKTLQENLERIKLLWMHDSHEPIGKPIELKETPFGLHVVGHISNTAKGRDILQLMRDDVVDELSIGFDPIDFIFEEDEEGNRIRIMKEVRLWDVSPVTWGANRKAKITEVNSVAPMRSFTLADRSREWDAASADKRVRAWAGGPDKENIDWDKYFQAHFWRDESTKEEFTGYKLGYVDIIDGEPKAIPRGIFAVAGVLQGARGGANIPDSDQATIKTRVTNWYEKMRRAFDDDSIVAPWENESGNEPIEQQRSGSVRETRFFISNQIGIGLRELEDLLQEALRKTVPDGVNAHPYVCDVFDDVVIYEIYSRDDADLEGLFKRSYLLGDDKTVSLGTAVEVRRVIQYEERQVLSPEGNSTQPIDKCDFDPDSVVRDCELLIQESQLSQFA